MYISGLFCTSMYVAVIQVSHDHVRNGVCDCVRVIVWAVVMGQAATSCWKPGSRWKEETCTWPRKRSEPQDKMTWQSRILSRWDDANNDDRDLLAQTAARKNPH